MNCFNDSCIYCDRDSPNGHAYCSEQCKLADSNSAPTTPTSSYFAAQSQSQSSQTYYGRQQASAEPPLTPSSSRTSLYSNMSSSFGAAAGISAQAKQDLQGYFNSFDQARAAKRRSSTRST